MTEPFITMKIRGIQAVKQALDALPNDVTVGISRKALKASAEAVLDEVLSRVPVASGLLRNSIKVRRTAGDPNKISVSAGNKNAWYAHLVEYGFTHTGHGRRKANRKPTSRGFVEGRAFMRNAAEARFEEVVDTFEETVVEQVDKAVEKMRRANPEAE